MDYIGLEQIREYCLSKNNVAEDMPFGEETLCFRVLGKIFLLTGINGKPLQINLKCDPERAIILREEHESIIPGYHMNKKHWNTLIIDGSLKYSLVKELIDHSHNLIVASLPKLVRDKIEK